MRSRACPFRSDSGGMDRSEAQTLDGRGALAPFLVVPCHASGRLRIFAGLSGFLLASLKLRRSGQVIIVLKKAGKAESNPFLLCWHGKSVAGSTDSLKPQALRVPSCRRAGLDRIRSASSESTCASQAKKAKGGSCPSFLLHRGTRVSARDTRASQEAAINCRSTSFPTTVFMALAI
jgi:hypothetical protein